jgi:hypothetical protein
MTRRTILIVALVGAVAASCGDGGGGEPSASGAGTLAGTGAATGAGASSTGGGAPGGGGAGASSTQTGASSGGGGGSTCQGDATAGPWARHTIDATSKGADGVRLADVNGDGRRDAAVGWEQGGIARAYLNPGGARLRAPWPAVTVGQAPNVEDAVFVDLDGDGAADVVTASEGETKQVRVHWAPAAPADFLAPATWSTAQLFGAGKRWMYSLPMQIDGKHGPDLVIGSKDGGAEIAWLEAPADARDVGAWIHHGLGPASWVMSLLAWDVDEDGDEDVVVTDRNGGPLIGARWLERPDPASGSWPSHPIKDGVNGFLADVADVDGDGKTDLVLPYGTAGLSWMARTGAGGGLGWKEHPVTLPAGAGDVKAASAGDLDLDGRTDLVVSFTGATGDKLGVVWLRNPGDATQPGWSAYDVGGTGGTKFDLVPLDDVDGDGDLDILTTEEIEQLGVVWYENPRCP